ncbi:MAG TPA: cutinase family protein [Streptosporangiaceae bacterium]|nr:cutinase family protein [Streptosporangiaceae bacterium]
MMIIKRRSALLGVALAALLTTLPATAPPAAAAARSAAANLCDTTPVFFGLHGMGEGPSDTVSAPSPEIQGFDYEQNVISGQVLVWPVPYTTVTASLWNLLNPPIDDVAQLLAAVNDGESALQSALTSYIKGCTSLAQVEVALVGYSMGAWVINKWLNDNPGEWHLIKAVVLYGDPCWIDGADRGLVRAADVADLVGCSSAKTYPYPAPTGIFTKVPFLTQSWCAYHDAVCGGGDASNLAAQVPGAVTCIFSNSSCPHNQYKVGYEGDGTLKAGAQFVVNQLIG